MLRIGLLSDTHIPTRAKSLPSEVLGQLTAVDLILHAGDLVSRDVVATLQGFAPVIAVAGNCDPLPVHSRFGRAALISIEGQLNIGLTHGDLGTGDTPERAYRLFTNSHPAVEVRDLEFSGGKVSPRSGKPHTEKVHCIIFGHSHLVYCWYYKGGPTD